MAERIPQHSTPTNKTQKAGGSQQDPYLYASLLNNWIPGQNPFQQLAGELTHKVTSILNLQHNLRAAQNKLDKMKDQVERVEGQIAEVNKKDSGLRLNKLR